jgi:hypothetical protein
MRYSSFRVLFPPVSTPYASSRFAYTRTPFNFSLNRGKCSNGVGPCANDSTLGNAFNASRAFTADVASSTASFAIARRRDASDPRDVDRIVFDAALRRPPRVVAPSAGARVFIVFIVVVLVSRVGRVARARVCAVGTRASASTPNRRRPTGFIRSRRERRRIYETTRRLCAKSIHAPHTVRDFIPRAGERAAPRRARGATRRLDADGDGGDGGDDDDVDERDVGALERARDARATRG